MHQWRCQLLWAVSPPVTAWPIHFICYGERFFELHLKSKFTKMGANGRPTPKPGDKGPPSSILALPTPSQTIISLSYSWKQLYSNAHENNCQTFFSVFTVKVLFGSCLSNVIAEYTKKRNEVVATYKCWSWWSRSDNPEETSPSTSYTTAWSPF